ncbi:TetR/AcrR family transcriptional regulator [Alphaproteobacteria bacterium]|nr:TetR/AcrR family transcriptional regulator [Alphaproteobacteria bacterium]
MKQLGLNKDDIPNRAEPAPAGQTIRERQASIARSKLIDATVTCLKRYGYSNASINQIQMEAGVSRGALTHHFPNKEDLIVATLDRLLEATLRPSLPSKASKDSINLVKDLQYIASDITTSREGEAMAEILIAMRSDTALHERVAPRLLQWNEMIDQAILGYYESPNKDDHDVVLIWTITRTFLRGLVLQDPFTPNPETIKEIIIRFGEIISPYLKRRAKPQEPDHA